jgi:hypothetical protein
LSVIGRERSSLELRVGGRLRSHIEIVDHPLDGPIFSGPRQEPFICQTIEHGLGPALDSDCNAKTLVQYYYKSTEPTADSPVATIAAALGASPRSLLAGFKVYDTSKPPPADVARVEISGSGPVNYIIRREVGVINRAIYDVKFLHQPGEPLPTPWTGPNRGWNGRLVYLFGGGCSAGYRQGTLGGAIGVADELLLSQGYATATSTLNIPGNDCNDRVSAETLSMVKEHFIKEYGEPTHTIGFGGSGGATQQQLIAQNYPGLLDGLIVFGSFPDITSTVHSATDCALLTDALSKSTQHWSDDQKTAVSGFATWQTCMTWASSAAVYVDPRQCEHEIPNGSIPAALTYDPLRNRKGARCDFYDNEINFFGRDTKTGFARRPLDNVGVQYGLAAFNAGIITADQFIDLNQSIGGYDSDGHIVAARTASDAGAVRSAYRRGLVLTGGGGLSRVPIIDWRWYSDDQGDVHDRYRSFVTRARLIAANGNADNQVILVDRPIGLLTYFDPDPVTSIVAHRQQELLRLMDRWLDNLAGAGAGEISAASMLKSRPSELSDGCWQVDGKRVYEESSYSGANVCNRLYPPHGSPRLAAGAPLTNDVLKCALKPIQPSDYAHILTRLQRERLKSAFPNGVCDYTKSGIGAEVTTLTWQRYQDEDDRMVSRQHDRNSTARTK